MVASNGYHTKKAYELMHEILTTEKLLKEHPEEFPESLQKGRMVERLSRKMGIARSTIQEYKQISNNLSPKLWRILGWRDRKICGYDAFKNARRITKSSDSTGTYTECRY